MESNRKKSVRGILRESADPERIEREKGAWGRAVREKHRDSLRESGEPREGHDEGLEESADLYAEIYAEDPELRALAESALHDWPE